RNYVGRGLAALTLAGSLFFSGCSDYISQPRRLEQRISQEVAQQNGNPDKYALLITGHDEKRFIHDLGQIYDTLIQSGFKKDDIYVLGSKAVSYRGKPHEIPYPVDDIATRRTIETVFSHLEKKIDEQDLLVVHISSHGDKITAKDENANSVETYQKVTRVTMPWEDDVILESEGNVTELELKSYLSKLRPQVAIVTTDVCYGGGIAERVGKNRVIGISASGKNETAHSGVGDSFCGFFYQAFRDSQESDANRDGRVTLDEAFDYAKSRHSWTKNGEDNPHLISDLDVSNVTIK
ncbi:caspase family protein, partial [Candidatus Woesearchaeota archaeon]|nr:caspase family protein [Candidatus Woesearchaeota archaeon]